MSDLREAPETAGRLPRRWGAPQRRRYLPTFGATDVAAFTAGGETFLAVAESLSESVRFRTDSRIYRFGP